MSHNTKQIICHWFLDGFKPESEYYAEVRSHFSAKELERIDAIIALQYDPNVKISKKDKAFVLYVLTVVMLTSKVGTDEDEHDD